MEAFELGSPGTTASAGLLGIWSVVPTAGPAPAFGAEARAPADFERGTEWRCRFSADPVQALAAATDNEARLDRARSSLARVDDRLDAFLRNRMGGATFGAAAPRRPEVELGGLLAQSRGEPAPPVAFWPGSLRIPGWDELARKFRQFVDQLNRLVLHYAWVETRLGDRFVARTTVGWSGSFQSEWAVDIGPSASQIHVASLKLALKSRATLMESFLTAVGCAMKLTAVLTMPGGILLALPAAWHFVQSVLGE